MPPVLKFLRFSSGENAERDLEILDKAVSVAKKNGINVEIIKEASEIRKLLTEKAQNSHSIYVCFPFEGKIYEKFKNNGFRIIGPQCVISCLLLEEPVPKQLHPVCNITMLGVIACCSSMKKEERNNLHELILQMGGEVTADFTSVVTHLIAKEVGSKKYQVAANNKVSIISPSWVYSCWENSKYEHIVATSDNVIKEHILPILKGCTICVTGLDLPQRNDIRELVEGNGGKYSGELNMKTCTHLLVEYPQGAKYKYAKQWKLHCISPSWLFDCMKQGHWLSEDPYKVELEQDSTMNRLGNITTRNEIQETMRSSTLECSSSKAAENAAKSLQNSKQNNKNNVNINCENDNRKLVFKDLEFDGIDVQNITFQDGEKYYLDGCQIYLQNKPGTIMDCCRKIINNGGGMRLNVLEDSITHVVLWNQPSVKVKKFLLEFDGGVLPHVVSPLWLIDSFKNGELMDVTDYMVVDVIDKEDIQEESEVFKKPVVAVDVGSAFATTVNTRFEEHIGDDTSLMNQYLSTNHESTRISQVPGNGPRRSSAENSENDETDSIEEELSPILRGVKFCIQRFSESHEANIESLIQEYSGSVTKSPNECDYAIVPLIYKNEVPPPISNELTLCWLEQSIESEELKNKNDSFLFHPITIPNDATPLKGCVITVSQYTGMERQHLFHLAEVLGAVAQEYFVRKESRKASMMLKASTHLILVNPEGSKYDASVKWGIPCVAKEWLHKCAISGCRVPEVDFSLDGGGHKGDNTINHGDSTTNNADKSVVDGGNNLVSFDLSNRGASIIDVSKIRKQQNTLQANDDVPYEQNKLFGKADSTGDATVTNDNDEKGVSNFHQILRGDVQEKDFSTFNTMISREKEHTIQESNNNKGNTIDISSPAALQSPQFALDKSRFSFDFGHALDGMQSPVGCTSQDIRRKSSRKSRGSLPLDVQFSEALQRAVDKHVPEEDRIALDNSFNKKNEELSKVLVGCVCVVSKKLSAQQASLHDVVCKLGGDTKFLYDDSCTHFIHQGRINDMAKDYLLVKKEMKCFVVSPHWLKACMTSGLRVKESEYPITYNPRMSLDVTKNRSSVEKMALPPKTDVQSAVSSVSDESHVLLPAKRKEKDPESSILETKTSNGDGEIGDETKSPEKPNMSEQQLDVQKKMEELMEATKLPRNRRTSSRRHTSSNGTKKEALGQPFNRRLRNKNSSQHRNSDSPNSSNGTKPSEVESTNEQFQTHVISYDVDATEREARERVLEQLRRASPSQDIESVDYPINKLKLPSIAHESIQETVPEEILDDEDIQHTPKVTNLLYDEEEEREKKKQENSEKYKFLFSGMTVADKIKYGAIIEELGGVFLDNQYFNTQSTHVIVHCPTRSEKFLAAVACGKWILHKSYLEASREAAMFVDEFDHEWGCRPEDSDFYASGKRWRTELSKERTQEFKAGAFKGWAALLCIEASKQLGFKRILEAGGGKVLAIRPPFDSIEGATHAFIGDKRQAAKNKLDYQMLSDAGIWVLKPEYISDFLTVYPKPSAMNYVLEEEANDGNNDDNGAPSTPGKRKASDRLVQKMKRHRK